MLSRDEIRRAFERVQAKAVNTAVPMEDVERELDAFMKLDAPAELLEAYRTSLSMAFEQRSPGHNPGV